jgi:hypothetical protein
MGKCLWKWMYIWCNITYWPNFHKQIYIAFKLPNAFPMCIKITIIISILKKCSVWMLHSHLINDTQLNGGTLWPKFIYIKIFTDHVQIKIIIINLKMKKILNIFLFTCTPIKHNNKTLFMENPKDKIWQQK